MPRRSTLATALLARLMVTAVGVVGYSTIAGMPFDDALYMTVITLSTVGYSEIHPLAALGRLPAH